MCPSLCRPWPDRKASPPRPPRLCCSYGQARRGRQAHVALGRNAAPDPEVLHQRVQILSVGAVLERGAQPLSVPDREDGVRRHQRLVVDQYGVTGRPDRGQRRQPLPVDRDGLRTGLPQAVDHPLHVPVAHPARIGESTALARTAATGVGALGVVDDELHPGAVHGSRPREQAHDLGLVATVLLQRLPLPLADLAPDPLDVPLQLIGRRGLPLDPVDQVLPLLGDHRCRDPRLGRPHGHHGGGEHEPRGDTELGTHGTGQAAALGSTPGGRLGVAVVERVVDHVVQQRHRRVRARRR